MENQHQHIKGYRDLTVEEINLMNSIKATGEAVGTLVEALKKHPGIDQRWVSISATELQQGFMALVRAVARPTTV